MSQAPVEVIDPPPVAPAGRSFENLRRSETVKAAGLAGAMMVSNVLGLAFTVIFTRLLGADDYGSLAALLSLTVIMFVPGYSLQATTARAGALGTLGTGPELAATLTRWTHRLLIATVIAAVAAALLREPLAALLNVDQSWAAAAVPPTAALWLMLCVQRGLLQATRNYRAVGFSVVAESVGRVCLGLALFGLWAGVTSAYLATFASVGAVALVLHRVLRRQLGAPAPGAIAQPLRELLRRAVLPVVALTLLAVLQNVDVIMAKHVLDSKAAGVYAAITVAGKAMVWVALGLGLFVLPEAARRAADGLDPRPVLARAVGLIVAIGAVALAIFALAPKLVIRLAFGEEYESGQDILLILGAAYALLAVTYVSTQFLLGLHHRRFIALLAVAAVALPLCLLAAHTPRDFAFTVLAVQAVTAVGFLVICARIRPPVRGEAADISTRARV